MHIQILTGFLVNVSPAPLRSYKYKIMSFIYVTKTIHFKFTFWEMNSRLLLRVSHVSIYIAYDTPNLKAKRSADLRAIFLHEISIQCHFHIYYLQMVAFMLIAQTKSINIRCFYHFCSYILSKVISKIKKKNRNRIWIG